MITALDTNVLLDIWVPDPVFGEKSWRAVMAADERGGLDICEVDYSELAPRFATQAEFDRMLDDLDIKVMPVPRMAAFQAGHAWDRYRKAGGKRTRIMADFLIGAHAASAADQFITRDQGFYRSHFSQLVVIDPALL